MQKTVPLSQVIDEMKAIGDMLVPHNYPSKTSKSENDILALKTRVISIDGYSVGIYFSRADYKDFFIETLQVFGEKAPFLPFCIVVELGKRFLGGHHLYLVEVIRNEQKVYCWTIYLDKDGRPIPSVVPIKKVEDCTYDGFQYQYLYPSAVNFH